jgi:alanine-glyoxylate transaminase/serine-glyoxylate transaminase/serine-pyruvate transaminase
MPRRILLGPGPSDVLPRVPQATAMPRVGHLHWSFIRLMDEVKEHLRRLFQTENGVTMPISGTGSAGVEACLCNLIEPGDPALVCVNGYFSERMCNVVTRCGRDLRRL